MSKRKETVTKVIDGDTFMTLSRKRVRLANVNAPEKNQRGGSTATNSLRRFIGGKQVEVNTVARDRYGRFIANVKVKGKSVNDFVRRRVKK